MICNFARAKGAKLLGWFGDMLLWDIFECKTSFSVFCCIFLGASENWEAGEHRTFPRATLIHRS